MKQLYCTQTPLRFALALALLLLAAPAFAQYDTGVEVNVPFVEEGVITLDGNADEAAWEDALVVNLTANWDPYGIPEPDVAVIGRLLFTEGALYVSVVFQDYQNFYWGEESWQGEQLLVGVDLPHEGGEPAEWDGWVDNMPNLGPVAYKIADVGITANWGEEPNPVAEGWVDGEVFVDDSNYRWGVEMAIYGDEITEGGQIGFNAGGATASQEWADDNDGEGTYGYFAWQVCENPTAETTCQYPGGNVMSDAASFATLNLGEGTSIEDNAQAQGFSLHGSFPNPFRSATTIEYTLERAAEVEVVVYDVLGREVATLAKGAQAAGTAQVEWDATGLPTGLYIAQLRVNGEVVGVRKMQLIR